MPRDIPQPRRWLNKRRSWISSKFINDTVWLSFTQWRWNNLGVRPTIWASSTETLPATKCQAAVGEFFCLGCVHFRKCTKNTTKKSEKSTVLSPGLMTRNKIFLILRNVYHQILFILSLEMTEFCSSSPHFRLLLPLLLSPRALVPLIDNEWQRVQGVLWDWMWHDIAWNR